MEFYVADDGRLHLYFVFQFPTGWNSTGWVFTSFSARTKTFQFPTGWNSTYSAIGIIVTAIAFQFPTGWNSTFFCSLSRLRRTVSIPNGMKFYALESVGWLEDFRFQFPTGWNSTIDTIKKGGNAVCFNSQRDEILHRKRSKRQRSEVVSIPNGMEFYAIAIIALIIYASFNSQRDGILPKRHRHSKQLRIVSIPNGMEFYAEIWISRNVFAISFNS